MFKAKFSKVVAAAAVTAIVVTSAGILPAASAEELKSNTPTLSQGALFSDVPVTHDHFESIYAAYDYEILSGYPDGTFKPDRTLTRGNVVKALGKYILAYNGLDISEIDLSGVRPFKDIPATHPDKELYNFSLLVRDAEIFTGDVNNNLSPSKMITRQQMAKVLVETFGFEDLPGVESRITDNDKAFDDAYRTYINILSENGITVVQNFNPTGTTTRGQFASFMVRSVDAFFEMEVQSLLGLINTSATVDELEYALDTYYLEFVDFDRMPAYFEAMKAVEFKSLEEVQAAIDAVNAQTENP